MAKVIITESLNQEINKIFKGESVEVFELIYSLKENPKKGKAIGQVGGILIKELKYKSFRFYFIIDGFKLKVLGNEELGDLIIKFVKMSDKKSQQRVIDEIKKILRTLGEEGFR